MMDKRTVLAIVLMAAVLILGQLWMTYTAPPQPQKPVESPARTKPLNPQASTAQSANEPPTALLPPPGPALGDQSRLAERAATVDTPLFRAVVSSEGGRLREFVLHYRGDKPLVIGEDFGPRGLMLGVGDTPASPVSMRLSTDTLAVPAGGGPKSLTLTGTVGELRVRETLTFRPDSYAIDKAVALENTSAAPAKVSVVLPWDTRQIWHEAKQQFGGQHPTEILWQTHDRVERAENLCDVPTINTDGQWVAVGSVAYMVALIPRSDGFRLVSDRAGDKNICEAKDKEPAGRATVAVQAAVTLPPRQSWEGRVTVYAGPKEYERLRAYGLEGAINFGGFLIPQSWTGGHPLLPMAWLGIAILTLMNWIYHYVHNYGVAIIVLTVVSKALFYPLTVKSMRSMRAMQALQPQVNALRSKYKSDPQRLNRETMELYRQHRVNPLGGCLPMLAQVPIFYALYVALLVSVELQSAAFICLPWLSPLATVLRWLGMTWVRELWICDLALPDPIYVLPIVMGITMFLQQKMTPVAGDPRQAKMMTFVMPVVFTFMFLNLASGLVLYWTVSNLLQIGQQYLMNRPTPARPRREVRHAS